MPDLPPIETSERETGAWRRRRRHRRLVDMVVVYWAIRAAGIGDAITLSAATGLGPNRLYPALWEMENNGLLIAEFEPGPRPQRRMYRPAL